jgi:hypothetical protein
MPQLGIKLRDEVWNPDVGRRAHVQMSVQGSTGLVRHEDFDLTGGQVLDVVVASTRLALFAFHRPSRFLVLLIPKHPRALHRPAAPRDPLFRRGAQEVPGGFLIAGKRLHGRIGSGGDIFLKPLADFHELGQGLQGEQECGVRAASGLQDLGETPVTEGSELVHDYAEERAPDAPSQGKGTGWLNGDPKDYAREWCVDLAHVSAFLNATQPKTAAALDLPNDSPARRQFLSRLFNEIGKRGVIDVLRHGIKHGQHDITLFYGTSSPGNEKQAALNAQNRFSVARQLRYSRDETMRALDLGLFINGLPVSTFELKNSLTKQTVADAVEQYRRDRDPREPLFAFGRCVVHFAVDDAEVRMCTELMPAAHSTRR